MLVLRGGVVLVFFGGHVMADDATADRAEDAVMPAKWPATPPTIAPLMQPLASAGTDPADNEKAVATAAAIKTDFMEGSP